MNETTIDAPPRWESMARAGFAPGRGLITNTLHFVFTGSIGDDVRQHASTP